MILSISKEESSAISIVRIIAMMMIVSCHFLQAYHNKWAWILNVGVQIFLVLSGYLVGNKDIVNWKEWFLSRFIKLYVPLYIYTTIALTAISYFTDINVGWMPFLKAGGIDGLNHLWFMKAIALSYLITPILYYFKKYAIQAFVVLCIVGVLEYGYIQYSLHVFSWFWLYAIGFYYACLSKKEKKITLILFVLLAVFFSVFSPIEELFIDSSPYCRIWHDVVGIALCLGGIFMISLFRICKPHPVVSYFDKNSFYIYITHHIYLLGPLSIVLLFKNYFVGIIVIFLLIGISTFLLSVISNFVIKHVKSLL